jgi:hypothetical protein
MKDNEIAIAWKEALKLIEEGVNELETICHEQRLEIIQLRTERDEARRMYCEAGLKDSVAICLATGLGWDYYKKETP